MDYPNNPINHHYWWILVLLDNPTNTVNPWLRLSNRTNPCPEFLTKTCGIQSLDIQWLAPWGWSGWIPQEWWDDYHRWTTSLFSLTGNDGFYSEIIPKWPKKSGCWITRIYIPRIYIYIYRERQHISSFGRGYSGLTYQSQILYVNYSLRSVYHMLYMYIYRLYVYIYVLSYIFM